MFDNYTIIYGNSKYSLLWEVSTFVLYFSFLQFYGDEGLMSELLKEGGEEENDVMVGGLLAGDGGEGLVWGRRGGRGLSGEWRKEEWKGFMFGIARLGCVGGA